MVTSVKPNAAIYVRISSDREGRELGVQRQEEDARKLAQRLGVNVLEVFSDNDISASRRSTKPRPAYIRMLEDVRAGRIVAVLAYSTSRLTRRPREFEDWIDLAEGGAVRISTVVAGDVDLTTAAGRFMARMLAARDSAEAEEMSERHKRERLQRREQGRWNGGNRPFGFERDGVTPRPDEQQLIRDACRDILAGRSLGAIAREWTAATDKTPQGRDSWLSSSVRDVLRNPRIAGLMPDERPAAAWQPVVDEATWRGVRALMADPARRHERGETRLLTGIAVCALCGATVNGGITKTGKPTYRCSAVKHLDRAGEPVDAYVTGLLLRYLVRERLRRAEASPGPAAGDTAGEAVALRARVDENADLFAAGDITGPEYARASKALRAQLDEVEARMSAAVSASALRDLPVDAEGIRAAWDAADVERRRAILRAARLSVVISPPGRGAREFDPATVSVTPPKDGE